MTVGVAVGVTVVVGVALGVACVALDVLIQYVFVRKPSLMSE